MLAKMKTLSVQHEKLLAILRLMKWAWIAFLVWIVFGGTIGEILQWKGFVEPYCDLEGTSDTYPECTPCKMHGSVFGVFVTNNCPNAFAKKILEYGIGFPRVFVAFLSMLIYVLVEPLNQISRILPALVLLPASIAVLFRTIFANFFYRININRGIHRGLLVGWLVLATLLAVQW